MFIIERSAGDRDGTQWVGDRVIGCVRDRRYAPRDIEIDVWMEETICVFMMASKR